MKKLIRYAAPPLILLITAVMPCQAAEIDIPHTFQAGTTAMASQVNANFSTVETALNDNDSRIAALEALVAALQNRIAELEESQVMALEAYITVDEDSDSRGTLVQIDGVNLRLTNGLGNTESTNGLGNLIIGYDETNSGSTYTCSDGSYTSETDCAAAGELWSLSHKTGSHYLVMGSGNNYSQFSGLVTGYHNSAINGYAVVTGGVDNVSAGYASSVSGGIHNIASGAYSSVSGGWYNEASGPYSSVSGGSTNTASGYYSSISGGSTNTASGVSSSVSGGANRSATGPSDWSAGGLFQDY